MPIVNKCKPPNVLFSFASYNEECVKYALSPDCKSFLLDSGAFTFMNGAKRVDFDSYTDKYIDFINAYKVPLFFEMDLDAVVGLQKVEEYRRRIESRTDGNIYTIRDGYPKQTTLRKDGHKCIGEKINEHNLKVFMKYGESLGGKL